MRNNVAFIIDNYRIIDHSGICFHDAVLKLKNAKKTITHEYEVISVFNLDEKEIREVYRDIIKFQDLHINHVIALDMTCLLDDPVLLKSIESKIKAGELRSIDSSIMAKISKPKFIYESHLSCW